MGGASGAMQMASTSKSASQSSSSKSESSSFDASHMVAGGEHEIIGLGGSHVGAGEFGKITIL